MDLSTRFSRGVIFPESGVVGAVTGKRGFSEVGGEEGDRPTWKLRDNIKNLPSRAGSTAVRVDQMLDHLAGSSSDPRIKDLRASLQNYLEPGHEEGQLTAEHLAIIGRGVSRRETENTVSTVLNEEHDTDINDAATEGTVIDENDDRSETATELTDDATVIAEQENDDGSIAATELAAEENFYDADYDAFCRAHYDAELGHLEHVLENLAAAPVTTTSSADPLQEYGSVFTSLEPEEIIPYSTSLDSILGSKGVTRSSNKFGHGNSGRLYDATIEGDAGSYAYKYYLRPVLLTKEQEKFWRQGDFAASRLHDIPNLIKTLFFVVIVKNPDGSKKKFYLPADKAQEFGKKLPAGAEIFIEGQLMGKAPGRTLQELRTRGEVSFDPQGKPFRSVAIAAHQFLCASHPRNLLHRDLNLNNIMYDPATEEVTIVDTGEALRLRRRGKTEEEVKNKEASNPPTTTKYTGTPWFMAPSVIHEREYGSEVDEASTALILLSLISEDDFEKFSTTRFGPRELERQTLTDLSFGTEDPTNFLNIYLNSVGPTSATAVALAAQPQLREVIDLAFRASAPGPAGEAAFAAFRDHPYFR